MARKKVQKRRGSREHGRGQKQGRGAGKRGGKGNAGSFNHKFLHYMFKDPRYFGRHGFKRPQSVVTENEVINVGDLDGLRHTFEENGIATTSGDTMVLDLAALGVDRLLGTGSVDNAYTVTVASASARAVQKIEAAGGSIVEPGETAPEPTEAPEVDETDGDEEE